MEEKREGKRYVLRFSLWNEGVVVKTCVVIRDLPDGSPETMDRALKEYLDSGSAPEFDEIDDIYIIPQDEYDRAIDISRKVGMI